MGSTNGAEIVLGLVLGALIAVARWREYRWRRTPLGQASIAFERAREQREQRERWRAGR